MARALALLFVVTTSACVWSTGGEPIGGGGAGGSGNVPGGGGGGIPDSTPGLPPLQAEGTWTAATDNIAGLHSECGNLTMLSARPDRDMIIASVAQHGLWAIADGATGWTRLGQGAGSAKITNRAGSIVYDPARPDTFWESGIYNGPGAYRTDDGGQTFTVLGDAFHADVISVDFTDPERKTLVYAGHEKPSWVPRSRDGGKTWENIGGGLPEAAGYTAVPLVLDANTYLLGTTGGRNGAGGILRTSDGGQSWTLVHANDGIADRPIVAGDNSLYWGLGVGLLRSTDRGMTWTRVSQQRLSRGWPSMDLLPDGRLLAIGGRNLLVSADHGATWRAIVPDLPYEPNGALYSKFRKQLYIWRWTCVDGPVEANQIMKIGFDHTKP